MVLVTFILRRVAGARDKLTLLATMSVGGGCLDDAGHQSSRCLRHHLDQEKERKLETTNKQQLAVRSMETKGYILYYMY